MRRISRLERSIDPLRTRAPTLNQSHYLCSACKYQGAPISTSAVRSAQEKLSITEKLRRKIWGTDTPPGLEDPYGGVSVFDQTKKKAAREKAEAEAAEHEARKQTAPVDSSYVPATTWDGLPHVGGYEDWWKSNWDPHHQFTGFLPQEVMADKDEISVALHRAIVEVLALKEFGIPLGNISNAVPGHDNTQEVQITLSPTGSPTLQPGTVPLENIANQLLGPSEDVDADRSEEDSLKYEESSLEENSTESEEVDADRSIETALKERSFKTYHAAVKSWNPAWLRVSLEDPDLKFAVIKRTMQLTGVRFPDAAIKSTNTVHSLLHHLVKPPKPRKLAEALEHKEELLTLPNVQVFAKRITPIHKEKQVGRWKLIEKELKERGLPITGHL